MQSIKMIVVDLVIVMYRAMYQEIFIVLQSVLIIKGIHVATKSSCHQCAHDGKKYQMITFGHSLS